MNASIDKKAALFTVADALDAVPVYRTPPPAGLVDLRLDGTQRSDPPSDLFEDLSGMDPGLASRYPDARALETLIAEREGVAPDRVIVTSGADDAIARAMRIALEPGRSALLTRPTFAMIDVYARLAGGEVREAAWPTGPLPVEALLARADRSTTLAAVVTPNNPTGLSASPDDLVRLADGLPRALLLVDAVYGDYAGTDPAAGLLARDDVLVVRSFSKAWALAGLRVGYAIGPVPVIAAMRRAGGPYPVSTLSLALAARMLERGSGNVRRHIRRVRGERAQLFELLSELDAETTPSEANFLLARVPHVPFALRALASFGLWARAFPGTPGLEGRLRITCPGDESRFARLEHALRTLRRPEALLLDMDGVLADVTRSYRAAILATAADFGVEAAPGDVARLKTRGGLNNDWELTRALLAERGVDAALAEVTERFEAHYKGGGGRPGLRHTETLLADRTALEALAAKLPLAVVTGRPRRDAERFLEEMGVRDLFRSLVCHEDAPGKPDPAPLRAAMDRLGVARVWMVGDTVDDITAARAAGALPIGIAPENDPAAREPLFAAGAAACLENVNELREILP